VNSNSNLLNTPSSQVITGMTTLAILFIVMFVLEYVYFASNSAATRFRTLVGYTANSTDGAITIPQNTAVYDDAQPVGMSVNERTGIEFSYSFYLRVQSTNFDGNAGLKHVFHKGYSSPWPLMGPGVFIDGVTNNMRVFMNTYANPYTYVDVQNIPVGKWFHVTINSYRQGIDVYVNGGLANRMKFENTLPYQNFGDIYIFQKSNLTLRGSTVPAINVNGTPEDFIMTGPFSGAISNLRYARYALSVGEIGRLLAQGPSSFVKTPSVDLPPYMADDWWSNQMTAK
jgi:Concanavalin A-like lectin/glucanases superfamily